MSRNMETVEIVGGRLALHYDVNGSLYFIEVL